jgi:hypothetical protein
MLAYVTKGLSLHWTSRSLQQVRVNRSISAIMLSSITSATGRLMHASLYVYCHKYLMQMMWIYNYPDQSDKSTGELSNKITECCIRKRARIQVTIEQYKTHNTHRGCKRWLWQLQMVKVSGGWELNVGHCCMSMGIWTNVMAMLKVLYTIT